MKLRLATPADSHLPYYSHSIVEAILTCPKWGLIRYRERKYFKANFRSMALEAGSTMHEVFSACRLWQLDRKQHLPEHANYHGERLFGPRWQACTYNRKPNDRDDLLSICFEVLNSSEFFDDPSDTRRTIANMEETTVRYVDEQLAVMDRNPIWVGNEEDATAPVGIEWAFDMVVNDEIRFIGTVDGITKHVERGLRLEENKTASRPDEAWREAFRVKSQPTGYTLAARLLTGDESITETKIIGVTVKQSRRHEDYISFVEHRDGRAFNDWYTSLMFAHKLAIENKSDPLSAPMFTHSCHRYFRACGFVDLCSAEREDQEMMYEQMETTQLSPSEQAVIGDG